MLCKRAIIGVLLGNQTLLARPVIDTDVLVSGKIIDGYLIFSNKHGKISLFFGLDEVWSNTKYSCLVCKKNQESNRLEIFVLCV